MTTTRSCGYLSQADTHLYGFMASDLGLTTEEVRDVMFAVDCGHNGITIRKSANFDEAYQ